MPSEWLPLRLPLLMILDCLLLVSLLLLALLPVLPVSL